MPATTIQGQPSEGQGLTGLVEEITLAATILIGKDDERIMVPPLQSTGVKLA